MTRARPRSHEPETSEPGETNPATISRVTAVRAAADHPELVEPLRVVLHQQHDLLRVLMPTGRFLLELVCQELQEEPGGHEPDQEVLHEL